MSKFKRALKIDSENHTIQEIENTGLESLQTAVGGMIEVAGYLPNGDCLLVDEEGLLRDNENFFIIGDLGPFAGNGCIVGATDSEGDELDAVSQGLSIAMATKFVTREQLQRNGILPEPFCRFEILSDKKEDAS